MKESRECALPRCFILGPTGSGKSAIAVALAERLGRAEIVSADAYQVYRRMSVLTAAPSPEEKERVPHHLVEFMEPRENNDAALHARRAEACIADIVSRGNIPIITGGSGLYVKFISHGISSAPPSDPSLRAELSALPLEETVRRLQKIDPEGAAATNLRNPRYVVRNLEIVLSGGKPLSYWRRNWKPEGSGRGFVVVRETAELDARIARRTRHMLENGAIEEVAALGNLSATAFKTLGLAAIQSYLAGNLTRAELETGIALATRQYAKRQRTWLRRESWTESVAVAEKDTPASVAERLATLLKM